VFAMDNRIRMTAEAAARRLLDRFQAEHPEWTEPATPLDELATWLDLYVETFHPADESEGTYGFVDSDEEENLIWLCRDLPETLRRFTLAHEIGHVVLHCRSSIRVQALLGDLYDAIVTLDEQHHLPGLSRHDPCHDADVQADMNSLRDQEQSQEALGIGEDYNPRSQRELAANIFAAELLIPFERLRTLYLTERVPAHTLSATFAVSHTAMLNRLAGLLKTPRPQEIPQSGTAGTGLAPVRELPNQALAPARNHQPASTASKRYDEFQQVAIEAPTPALIIAGPGSGKTSTLIGRTNYLIRTLDIPPQQILALTFSRKAAQEMEERLQQLLDDNYALPKVSTFHAFCADLLRQHATLVGLRDNFTLIDEAEGYFLLRQQASKIRLRHYLKLHSPAYYFPEMLKAISRAKDELVSPKEYTLLAQQMKEQARDEEALEEAEKALEVAHIYTLYHEALSSRGDTDFGGLLALAIQLLQEHPEVLQEQQQKYQHILVDEFQDVNRASAVLLRVLAGETRRVWVVGDSNQAIYGFRGASPANISQFEADFPGAVVLPLSRNYRSRPDLVAIAESFRCVQLELGQEPGKNQPVRLTPPETCVTLAKASDDSSELAGIIQDMRYKRSEGYAYKDIAVLCRTRAQARKITGALAKAGLPVIERGSTLEQEHTRDILSILLLLTDSSGMGLLRAARQQEHPLSQDDIEILLQDAHTQHISPRMLVFSAQAPLNMSLAGQQSLQRLSEILQALHYATDTWSLLVQYLFIETSLVRDLLSDSENSQSRSILADYERLLQLARHYDQQQHLRGTASTEDTGEAGSSAESLTLEERIKGFLEYLTLLVLLRQDSGNRENPDEDGAATADIISIMTVHASKGLEYPVVYMPGLAQRRFPTDARASSVNAPHGMLPTESLGKAAHESGESCLFYVGVTRARDHLILSHSERYGKQKAKRSLYLDALEAGLPVDRITKLYWEQVQTEETRSEDTPVAPSSQPGEAFIQAMKSPTLSANAIEAYQRCPRQYAYSAIYHFANEEDTYQLFWQATQKTVEMLRKQLQESNGANGAPTIPTQSELQTLYTQHWQELGGHTAPFATLYEEHGHEVIETVRRKILAQEDVSWDTRPGFQVDIAGKAVRVTVDRIEQSTSSQPTQPVRFVRTRFGRSRGKPSAEIRELLYTLAYRQQYPGESIELHSHNLSTGEVVPIKMTARKEQSLYDEVEKSIEGLEQNNYPAKPDAFRCPTCPYFFICPA
jgi:superfamily I DNA/RNA helicase